MGTVALIVGGLVAISIVAVLGDMVTKVAQARAKAREASPPTAPTAELEALRSRVALLESRLDEREEGVRKLQDEVRFVTRMLEDRSQGRSGG